MCVLFKNLQGVRMKNLIKFGAIALFSSAMTLQSAEFESNVAMSSDYVWRGMTQTDGEPAISGGFDIAVKVDFISVLGLPTLNLVMEQLWN